MEATMRDLLIPGLGFISIIPISEGKYLSGYNTTSTNGKFKLKFSADARVRKHDDDLQDRITWDRGTFRVVRHASRHDAEAEYMLAPTFVGPYGAITVLTLPGPDMPFMNVHHIMVVDRCNVCQEHDRSGYPAACGHSMCSGCTWSWIKQCHSAKRTPTCPMCRTNLRFA